MATRGNPIFHARIERNLYKRLMRYSAESGQTFSDLVRDALALYVEYHEVPEYEQEQLDGQIRIEE